MIEVKFNEEKYGSTQIQSSNITNDIDKLSTNIILPQKDVKWGLFTLQSSEWLLFYYGEQIQSTFNQLDFIDSENLPIGLITLMKTTKIDWNNEVKEEE
ncbi:unnamed protein product [Rotaria sordida]|uniref:Uncharacterized protein n=1 Tax=Rotaria sordida TaxID=392033 RepID=A0A818UNH0_9BILA|nr:unnamed protein product [Rotaria sordida]